MKITNNNKIPEPIYRAICQNWYSGSGADHFCSVTELLKPPKLFVLEKRYKETVEQEASDLIWSLMGSAMHRVLEASETKDTLNEERLYIEINGKTISGGIDLYENSVISDFKFTSVWNYIYSGRKKEWEQQLNLYSYLYQSAGFDVETLQIIAVFRDWSARKSKFEKDYPNQIEIIPIRKWSIDQCENLIGYRFRDPQLLAKALRHRSIIAETGDSRNSANERLEFLGDAVLDLIVSEQLYKQYPDSLPSL